MVLCAVSQHIAQQGVGPAVVANGLHAHVDVVGLEGQALAVVMGGSLFIGGIVELVGHAGGLIPAVHVEDGLVAQKSQVRGKKQMYSTLVKGIGEKFDNNLEDRTVIIGFGDNEEDFEIVKNKFMEEYKVKDLYCVNIGCAICSHIGPGVLAISCM